MDVWGIFRVTRKSRLIDPYRRRSEYAARKGLEALVVSASPAQAEANGDSRSSIRRRRRSSRSSSSSRYKHTGFDTTH